MGDIIEIDDGKFRKVRRPAKVGDRVLIDDAVVGSKYSYGYGDGEVYVVTLVANEEAHIRPDGTEDSEIYLEEWGYVVLEPLEDLTETLAQLAVKVAKMEEELAEVKTGLRAATRGEEGVIAVLNPQEKVIPIKQAALTRGDVIRQAKSDVLALELGEHYHVPTINGTFRAYRADWLEDTVKFIVNREKRTVVALLVDDGRVWARGIAKCAPGDVFSEPIGKAIALRRALGLEVPSEYTGLDICG